MGTILGICWYTNLVLSIWIKLNFIKKPCAGQCFIKNMIFPSPALAVSMVFCSMRKRISLTASSADFPNTSNATPAAPKPGEPGKNGEELGLSSNRTGERSFISGTVSWGSSICSSPLHIKNPHNNQIPVRIRMLHVLCHEDSACGKRSGH